MKWTLTVERRWLKSIKRLTWLGLSVSPSEQMTKSSSMVGTPLTSLVGMPSFLSCGSMECGATLSSMITGPAATVMV